MIKIMMTQEPGGDAAKAKAGGVGSASAEGDKHDDQYQYIDGQDDEHQLTVTA